MSYVTIPSYEGNSPFIYVYYSEDDTRLALPVLARLYNEGLRMWSWNGSPNATEVQASRRIGSCAALLVFLSENLSRDIDRGNFEAMEALRCNKVKYFVRLSDVELPFDWGKSETNIVIDYVRSNESAFWLSVYDCDIIEKCRGPWPSVPIKTGMSVFDSIDSSELSDEYSSILKIIGESPALDRSGVPVNAEDIALFAGAGEFEEEKTGEAESVREAMIDELNRKSMEDLFGMLDEISVSTQQKAEELRSQAEKRRSEQEKAAMETASLPFQHDATPLKKTSEPPVPALSFTAEAQAVEIAAGEMFGDVEEMFVLAMPEESGQTDDFEIVIVDPEPEVDSEPETEPARETASFEDFIYGLEEPVLAEQEAGEEETVPEEIPEEPASVPMATSPKTVEIAEGNDSPLLPPASGSLTGFTLPDDNFVSVAYAETENEDDSALTARKRAAAAEESRRLFESAIENAAFKVTGRIVARHSKGNYSVGLRVRQTEKQRISVPARVKAAKTVKVEPVPQPVPEAAEEPVLSRAERRARRRRKSAEPEAVEEVQESVKKVTVVPELVIAEKVPEVTAEPVAEAAESAAADSTASENEAAASRRKKRHPHNSSGLMELLRALRNGKKEEPVPTEEVTEQDSE